jgi:hypothetical protein
VIDLCDKISIDDIILIAIEIQRFVRLEGERQCLKAWGPSGEMDHDNAR